MSGRLKKRKDAISGGKRLQRPHDSPDENPNTRCPDFSFHYTVDGYSVRECDDAEKLSLIDTLWQLSRRSWLEIKQADRTKRGSEKIPVEAIKKQVPSRITLDVGSFLALRFGQRERLIGFQSGRVFHIVWVDPRHDVY